MTYDASEGTMGDTNAYIALGEFSRASSSRGAMLLNAMQTKKTTRTFCLRNKRS